MKDALLYLIRPTVLITVCIALIGDLWDLLRTTGDSVPTSRPISRGCLNRRQWWLSAAGQHCIEPLSYGLEEWVTSLNVGCDGRGLA